MNSADEPLTPASYDDVIGSAWFELKDLYEQFFHAGPEFDAYADTQIQLFESGQECEFRDALRDRVIFGVPDRIHPKGAFFVALAAAYSSEAQKRLGNTEAAWAYVASSMYWIGHARVAVQIDALRKDSRSAQARKAAQSKNPEQWRLVEKEVQALLASRPADAPPMTASKAAHLIHARLKGAFDGKARVISRNTLYQDFAQRTCFAVQRRQNGTPDF